MKTSPLLFTLSAAAVGGLVGVVVFILGWRLGWPYLSPNWLGPLLGADGESAYDAMLIEIAVEVALIFGAVALVYSLRKQPRA